jgi:hypothetical protein
MATTEPLTELDARFSGPDAEPTPWADGLRRIQEAPLFWVSTVRRDGRPHVTPLIAVWVDGAAYFCTGAQEQKARNLEHNAGCVLTTGSNDLHEGLDVVLEGDAVLLRDDAALHRVADAYVAKYGEEWRFSVDDGAFVGEGDNRALVFELRPTKVLGFAKDPYAHTRWRFA